MAGAWVYFTLLTAVHVYANWRGVGCLALRTLNAQRAVLVCSHWAETRQARTTTRQQHRRTEPLGLKPLADAAGALPIRRRHARGAVGAVTPLGVFWAGARRANSRRVRDARGLPIARGDLSRPAARRDRAEIARRDGAHPPHAVGRYILRLSASGRPLVLLHDAADAADALRAHLQCQLLRKRAAESGASRGTPGLAAALGTCALRLLGARRLNPPKLSDSEVVALGETARAAAREFDALRAALIAAGWTEAGLRADRSTTWRYREVGEGGIGARAKAA